MKSLNNHPICLKVRNRNRGFGVTEMIVALLLLGVMVSYVLPLLNNLGRIQRRIDKQTLLQQTAINLVEELHTLSAEELQKTEAVRKKLEKQMDPQKYKLILTHHPGNKPEQPMRIDLELHPHHEKEVLSAVKLSTWISFPASVKEAS